MKVISLTEPYETLIKNGIKKIETRSWKTSYRGRIYIHASLTKIPKEWKNNSELMNLVDLEDLNFGNIICSCELVDCIYMTEEFIEKLKKDNYTEYVCGVYEVGRYAWILDNVKVLDKVVAAKGHLGIWNYDNLK